MTMFRFATVTIILSVLLGLVPYNLSTYAAGSNYEAYVAYEDSYENEDLEAAAIASAISFVEETEEMLITHFVQGFPDGTFRPDESLTRAETMQMFFNISSPSEETLRSIPNATFTDVSEDSWYFQAISYLKYRGVVNGHSDGSFMPNEAITNEEFAILSVRFFTSGDIVAPEFRDIAEAHWEVVFVNIGFIRGWLDAIGTIEENYNPEAVITRAQSVALMNYYLGRIPCEAFIAEALANPIYLFTDLDRTHWSFYDIMEAAINRTNE